MIWVKVLRSSAVRSQMVSGCNDSGFCKVDVEDRQRQEAVSNEGKELEVKNYGNRGK